MENNIKHYCYILLLIATFAVMIAFVGALWTPASILTSETRKDVVVFCECYYSLLLGGCFAGLGVDKVTEIKGKK